MKTRAKLVCVRVDEIKNGGPIPQEKTGETVSFKTLYDHKDTPEDNNYSKFTPNGSCSLTITNPELFGAFEESKPYYFDITPA